MYMYVLLYDDLHVHVCIGSYSNMNRQAFTSPSGSF